LGRARQPGAPQLQTTELAALGVGGLVCLVGFLIWETKREQPLIDLSLFKGRMFAVGNAAVFVFGGVFMAPLIFLPLYMMRVQGVSETRAGLAMVPMVVGILIGNVASGQLSSRL